MRVACFLLCSKNIARCFGFVFFESTALAFGTWFAFVRPYNNFCTAKERTNFGLFDGSSGQRISLINISFGVRFLLHRVEKM